MRRTARWSIVLVLLATAACGAGASGDDGAGGAASPTTAAAAPRTVEHAFGRTEVPGDPRRIVVLNQYSLLDYLLAVGVKPVGSSGDQVAGFPFGRWLQGQTEGVEMVGGTEAPNLEKIAALRPDLILANPWQTDLAPSLNQIAPTIGVPLTYAGYEDEFRFVAGLVGRSVKAEEVIARHRSRLEAFKSSMGTRLASTEVSVARLFPEQIRVEGKSYVTTLLAAAGMRRPPAHTDEAMRLSPEQLPTIDGDVLFVYSAANAAAEPDNAKARAAFEQNPLWANLRAVRNGQVHVVDSFLWAGGGMSWADAVLDDISSRLLPRRN
ncbi:MAG: ABC transporter substrate-binding protein [Acidimicrobiia bacterium]